MTLVRRGRAGRDYPPLVLSALLMLGLLALMPSALNLPQSSPTETLEYAPVPPDDEVPPSPEGNFSSLGLGSSGSLGSGAPGPQGDLSPIADAGPVGVGKNPSTKRCVGNPPRQTADAMSPPCVAHFDGDNGGATAPGVSREEVLILVYIQAQEISAGLSCHQDGCDVNQYYDLGKPEGESNEDGHDEGEAYWPAVWRVWQRYFNDRYQTYGRFVHVWVHFGTLSNNVEARRADVADAAAKVDPFAIVADVNVNGEAYANEWGRRRKVVFMSKTSSLEEVGFDARFFQKYPGRIWDYSPSVQQLAENYANFVCAQVVGHPVSFAGDGTNGQPRKLGLLVTREPARQNRVDYAKLVRARLERCGATIVSEEVHGTDPGANPNASAAAMRQAGVTTIIDLTWLYGFSKSVARQVPPWRPEWIVQMDNVAAIQLLEEPSVFQHARNLTIWPRVSNAAERPCEQAFREVDPQSDSAGSWTVCYTYNAARMLFTGIQVAGPRLTGPSLDRGMHAIPDVPSGDPKVPACFYRTDDYTCVKDLQVQWWDPTGQMDGANHPGCWRSMDGGRRYLAHEWPTRDVEAARGPSDGCNHQGSGAAS